ncbi:MAG TPA: hypothetical protein VKK79_23405, partial [Candidatus Lokiarchaeia archaeon]|nr:hypothetical protein [Candidatus Lokiarchaeia archaeon]
MYLDYDIIYVCSSGLEFMFVFSTEKLNTAEASNFANRNLGEFAEWDEIQRTNDSDDDDWNDVLNIIPVPYQKTHFSDDFSFEVTLQRRQKTQRHYYKITERNALYDLVYETQFITHEKDNRWAIVWSDKEIDTSDAASIAITCDDDDDDNLLTEWEELGD